MKDRRFNELITQEKIDFLIHAQKILMTYHPASDFLFRRGNVKDRLAYAKDLCSKYQGFVHCDENILVLYNRVFVSNELDPIATLRDHKFKPPMEHYNAVTIDFVVFRNLADCKTWALNNYDPRIAHVIWVKNGVPQLYKTEKILAKALHLPHAVHPIM